jgi:hypothetical protein
MCSTTARPSSPQIKISNFSKSTAKVKEVKEGNLFIFPKVATRPEPSRQDDVLKLVSHDVVSNDSTITCP